MKITICGSIAFYDEMLLVKEKLEKMGHEVKLPPHEILDGNGQIIPIKEYYQKRKQANENDQWIWDRKSEAITIHFEKIKWSDTILALNYDKNNIKGYVGGNTLIEVGVAFFLGKKIYFLNPIPDLSYKEEILGMRPVVINGNLDLIK